MWISGPWTAYGLDDVAIADVRARVAAVLGLGAFSACLLAYLVSPGAFAGDPRDWLLLFPLAAAVALPWIRRGRLGETGYLITQTLGGLGAAAFIAAAQPSGSHLTMELALILPCITMALFSLRRSYLIGYVVLVIAMLAGLIWARDGSDPSVPANIVGESFMTVLVTTLIRQLRNMSRDSLRRAERNELTDPLTGLANRRGLERYPINGPRALLVLDIDHFKQVNDTAGHAAGDELLRRLAAVLTSSLRADDIAVRLGGEEFLVVADPKGAVALAERLRAEVATALAPITVSIGVLQALPTGGEPLWHGVDLADQALYEAKRAGRNRVVVAALAT